jgi:hypothetical protein
VQQGTTWPERQASLGEALVQLERMQNRLSLTKRLPETVVAFYERPFEVIGGVQVADALVANIVDLEVRGLAERRRIGSVGQWNDSTSLLSDIERRLALRALSA